MAIYHLSLVVPGRRDLGAIRTQDHEPQLEETVILGEQKYRITGRLGLLPPKGDTVYWQLTCQAEGQ